MNNVIEGTLKLELICIYYAEIMYRISVTLSIACLHDEGDLGR
jgi:hypothetical protein